MVDGSKGRAEHALLYRESCLRDRHRLKQLETRPDTCIGPRRKFVGVKPICY
jgi:hypothetical protein